MYSQGKCKTTDRKALGRIVVLTILDEVAGDRRVPGPVVVLVVSGKCGYQVTGDWRVPGRVIVLGMRTGRTGDDLGVPSHAVVLGIDSDLEIRCGGGHLGVV